MEWKETDFNKNTLIDSPVNHCSLTDRAMTGTVVVLSILIEMMF